MQHHHDRKRHRIRGSKDSLKRRLPSPPRKAPSVKEVGLGLMREMKNIYGVNPDMSNPEIQQRVKKFLIELPTTHPEWQRVLNKVRRDQERKRQQRLRQPKERGSVAQTIRDAQRLVHKLKREFEPVMRESNTHPDKPSPERPPKKKS